MAFRKKGIEVKGLERAVAKLSVLDRKTLLAVEKVLERGVRRGRDRAKRRVARDTGALAKSIKGRVRRNELEGYIEAHAPHAHLIEFGAKATTTQPRKGSSFVKGKRALKIGERYAMKAHIPARRARPFMLPAAEEVRGEIDEEALSLVEQAIREVRE